MDNRTTIKINGMTLPTYGVGVLPHHMLSPKGKILQALVKGVKLDTWCANAITEGVCGDRYIRYVAEDGYQVVRTWVEGKGRNGFTKGYKHKDYTMPEDYRKQLYTQLFGRV